MAGSAGSVTSEGYALLWGAFVAGSWVALWLFARGITRELRAIREELAAERASAWLTHRWRVNPKINQKLDFFTKPKGKR